MMPVCHPCQSSEAHSSSFFFFFFIPFCPSQKSTSANGFSLDFFLGYLCLCSFHCFNFNLLIVFDSSTFAFHLDTSVLTIVVCFLLCFSSPKIFIGFPSWGNWKLLVEVVWVAGICDMLLVGGGVTFGALAYFAPPAI